MKLKNWFSYFYSNTTVVPIHMILIGRILICLSTFKSKNFRNSLINATMKCMKWLWQFITCSHVQEVFQTWIERDRFVLLTLKIQHGDLHRRQGSSVYYSKEKSFQSILQADLHIFFSSSSVLFFLLFIQIFSWFAFLGIRCRWEWDLYIIFYEKWNFVFEFISNMQLI